jgi:DNA primase
MDMVAAQCAAQQMDRAQYRFSRREVREYTELSDTQLRVHLDRLVQLEYLLVHRGMRGQSFVYELLFDGPAASESPHLSGLIDVTTIAGSRGSDPRFAQSTRGGRGPNAEGVRSLETSAKPVNPALLDGLPEDARERHIPRPNGRDASYVPTPTAVARS